MSYQCLAAGLTKPTSFPIRWRMKISWGRDRFAWARSNKAQFVGRKLTPPRIQRKILAWLTLTMNMTEEGLFFPLDTLTMRTQLIRYKWVGMTFEMEHDNVTLVLKAKLVSTSHTSLLTRLLQVYFSFSDYSCCLTSVSKTFGDTSDTI